jgi:hypothetical protein
VNEAIKTELKQIKKESFSPGMDYEFTYNVPALPNASEDQGMI